MATSKTNPNEHEDENCPPPDKDKCPPPDDDKCPPPDDDKCPPPYEDECPPLDDLVEQLGNDAAKGEFDKKARDELGKIAAGASKQQQDYKRDYDELLKRWNDQDCKIKDLGCRLSNCFPDWKHVLEKKVCELVIKPIRDTRCLLYYGPTPEPDCPPPPPSCEKGPKIGPCETTLYEMTYCLDLAKRKLDAWTEIGAWIKNRLDKNQALYDEICKLDKCEEYAVALYIYYFELLPAHEGLDPGNRPPPESFEEECCGGTCLPNCGCIGFPWLVKPEDYLDYLNQIACCWRDAGRKHAEAQAAYDWIDVLKDKLKEDDTPESRRAKATEALTGLKCGDGNGGSKDPDQQKKPDSNETSQATAS